MNRILIPLSIMLLACETADSCIYSSSGCNYGPGTGGGMFNVHSPWFWIGFVFSALVIIGVGSKIIK